jgi:hypothetical protein
MVECWKARVLSKDISISHEGKIGRESLFMTIILGDLGISRYHSGSNELTVHPATDCYLKTMS